MSEEEKKVVEAIKDFNSAVKYHQTLMLPSNTKIFDKVLDLIEKQQKEIEELENRIDLGLDFRNEEIDKYMQENYISKDKIREILDNTEKNIEEDRPSIVLESLILEIKELLGEKDDTKV